MSRLAAAQPMPNTVGIVIVGRNNRAKRSDALARVVAVLAGEAFEVRTFTSARIEASERINARLARRFPAVEASRERGHPWHLRILRLVLKAMMVLHAKERLEFARALFQPKPYAIAHELDRFVDRLPFQQVHLITHSAGGISATKIAQNPKVAGICVFGYPFKHPDHPPEPYRTRHLPKVTKPLLIIQGLTDEYGAPSPEMREKLPPRAQIIPLDCGHDYAGISDAEFETVLIAVRQLIAGHRATATGPATKSP